MRSTDLPEPSARRIVIGYDGSDEARHAIATAARVLYADCALVVNVWDAPAVVAASVPQPLLRRVPGLM